MFEEFKKGQPVAVSIFEKAILEDKISHAYLIDINNYEKAYELIITFVKSIVCKNKHSSIEESKDCYICKRIDDGNYLELKIIEPDGTWIKKEQLMELQDSFSTIGIEGSKRIYIIKECDKMNLQTANSILKFLEEPADNIIAILMTNNISKLLETIVSRCQLIRLNNSKSTLGNTIEKFANLTLSETVDWIYDTFGIFIEIDYIRIPYNFGKKFKYFVIDITDENGFGGDIIVRSDESFETKDDAIIEAINHLFNKLEKICSLHKVETKPIEVPKENFTFDGVELKVKSEKIEVV